MSCAVHHDIRPQRLGEERDDVVVLRIDGAILLVQDGNGQEAA